MTKCLIHLPVFSRLIYCCIVLCKLPLHRMYKLERIQRRAVRVLYKLNYASIVSRSALMRTLCWIKCGYVVRRRLLCITHEATHL